MVGGKQSRQAASLWLVWSGHGLIRCVHVLPALCRAPAAAAPPSPAGEKNEEVVRARTYLACALCCRLGQPWEWGREQVSSLGVS